MRRKTLLGQLLRLLWLLIVPVTLLLTNAAKRHPEITDAVYSQKIYPFIRNAVSAVTRHFPYSLAEMLIYTAAAALAVILIVLVIRLIKGKKHAFIRLVSFFISVILFAGCLFTAFYAMWGFNYYRPPIGEKLALPDRQYTKEELYSVCLDLSANANALREKVSVDTSGVFCGELSEMDAEVAAAFIKYGESHPLFKAPVPPAKHVVASEFLNRCGISGIYIFLTEEPNINVNEPFLYMPYSAAHETSHFLGWAREEDASFAAFLVCIGADSSAVAYSGYMHALVNCGNALADADAELYRELWSTYSEGMKADLADYSAHYDKYADTETYKTSNDLNDSYLKFNDQEKGVLSYEEDVSLILRYYDCTGFFG